MKRFKLFTVALATLLHTTLVMAPVAHPQENNVIAGEQVDIQRLAAARELILPGENVSQGR